MAYSPPGPRRPLIPADKRPDFDNTVNDAHIRQHNKLAEMAKVLGMEDSRELYLNTIRGLLNSAFRQACQTDAERQDFKKSVQSALSELVPDDAEPAPAAISATETAPSLPAEAPELWLNRTDRTQTPADFIKRVYADWLGRELTQAHIKHLDKSLYLALHKWLQSNEWPRDLNLPTKREMNDRRIIERWPSISPDGRLGVAATLSGEERQSLALYQAARRRAQPG